MLFLQRYRRSCRCTLFQLHVKYGSDNLGLISQSLTDRTLDQMCTVTRPGLASIAAATAVELLVSLLQHPEGLLAQAPKPNTPPEEAASQGGILGMIPHQLRGFLAQFRNLPIVGAAYDKCAGCSETVSDYHSLTSSRDAKRNFLLMSGG